MTPPLTFVFPLPENLANARMHWAVKNLKRRDFFDSCDARQNAGLLPPPPKQPFQKVVVVNECLYLAGHMDDDNAAHRVKWIWDWLKTRGYIADDRKKNIVRMEYPKQRVKRDNNYRVELTIQELKA